MLTISAAIIYVATKCIDQFIKEEGYSRIKLFFFPKDKYVNRLRDLIMAVLDEYAAIDPNRYTNKIAFYHSPEAFQALIDHVLLNEIDLRELKEKFDTNPNVQTPSSDEVKKFFEYFYARTKADSKLRKVFIEENYKAEIFEISAAIGDVSKKIETVADGIASVETKIDNLGYSNPVERPVITPDYVASPEESKLKAILSDEQILLLTGVSFCGKSQLAKTITEFFVFQGFKYQGGSDVDEANRFLRNLNGKHIYLLEDPFGHNIESENKVNLRKVEELIRNIAPSNKLIITTRSEVLTSAKGVENIQECAIEGRDWLELTTRSRDFLLQVWDVLSGSAPHDCQTTIKNHLAKAPESQLLQVGQLAHLSRLPSITLIGKSLDVLLHLAKADSRTLSTDIRARGQVAIRLYLVLGLAASTTQGVTLGTLAYILDGSESYPGFLKKQGLRTHNPKRSGEVSFPVYDQLYHLKEQDKTELVFFIERGYLQLSNEQVYFRHPTYQEAARYILAETATFELEHNIEKIKRTLGCLSKRNASYMASNLSSVCKAARLPHLKDGILKLAYKYANRSIFPSVRDWLLKFLLENLSTVDEEMQDGIFNLIDKDMSSSDIFWQDDQPFYTKFDRDWFEEDIFDHEAAKSAITKLNSSSDPSTLELWMSAQLAAKPDFPISEFPNEEALDVILNAEETFIRSKIAYAVLNRVPNVDQKILERILGDTNPWVVVEGIKGAIFAYPFYTSEQREKILPMLQRAVENSFVIARIKTLLTCFGIDYGYEHIDWELIKEENKVPMWELWAMIFPIFMEKMPISVSIHNSGRFGQTMDAAVKYLKNTAPGLRVAEAYYSWVDARISSGLAPDTHELGVISYLLEISDDHQLRLPLFDKILNYHKSSLMLYSISWAMSDWENLSTDEKQTMLALCRSDRADKRWILATAISRTLIPQEIQLEIFGKPDLFNLPANEIIAAIPQGLLSDALEIYIGDSHLIGHLGLSHSRSEKWHEILEYVLISGHEPDFRNCLREFILHVINGPASEWRDSYLTIWETMCAKEELRDILSEQLILESARSNASIPPCTDLWKALIKVHPGELKATLAAKVTVAIEAIQRHDASDIFEFFDGEFLDMIINNCQLDATILSVFLAHKDDANIPSEQMEELLNEVANISQTQNIRLEITFDYIQKYKDRESHHPRFSELERLPNLIYEKGGEWIAANRERHELENWIG